MAFILLIAAISSFWFSGSSFREGDVVFEIEGPTQITSGDEIVYRLKYENQTRSILHDLDFVFFYPEGSAVLTGDEITENHSQDFAVGELAPGEKGEKEFRVFVIGERGAIKTAKATVSFKSGSLSSVFEKKATLSTTIVDSPIVLTLVAPPSVISGVVLQYILDYRNSSGEDISDLILELDYPDGFKPQEFNPEPISANNGWNVKLLKKGAGGRVTVNGVLNGREGESKVITARLKRKISGQYVDYQKMSTTTVISNPALGLELLVNNLEDYSASLGDRLTYTVKYSNNSNTNFFGMNLVVKLDGDMFDFSTLDTGGGFYDGSAKTITWGPSVVPDFGTFSLGASGKINFNIALKSFFPSAIPGSSQDKFVKMSAKFGTLSVPTGYDVEEVSVVSSLISRITTQPALNQSVYYNDSVFGSSGPLPMKVGEDTYFTVYWQISNPGNDVEGVEITSKLLPGVEWTGDVRTNNDLPSPSYNPNSSLITWSFSKLPYGAGILSDKYEASFRIKVKPASQHQNSYISLVDAVRFAGTDSFTKQSVIVNKKGLTSNDLADRPREGTVR